MKWRALSLAVIVFAGCSEPVEPSLASGASRERLQFILDSTVTALHVPGAVAAIVTASGDRYTLVSGLADIGNATPMNSLNRFRIGSVTKTMVATAMLQLVDEGNLKLDDVVSRWLPGIVPGASVITVRQLLNHTSGLADYLDDPGLQSELAKQPGRSFSAEELIAASARQPVLFSPGQSGRWGYSNTNYILAGMIVEKITGASLESELKRRIFDRLQMISTDYPATTGLKSPFSRGYADSASSMNTDVTTLVSPTVAGGAGAVVSSVGDLVTWASALARGQLVSDSLHARQLTPVVASGTTGYGLGVETFSHWVGHSGEFPGYEASMYSRPEVGTIVVLVNKTPTTVSASYAIFNELRWAEFGLK